MQKIFFVFLLAIALCFPTVIFGETIIFKSGKTVEGKITERTNNSIKVDMSGVTITYYLDEIKSIDGKPASISNKSATIEIVNPEYAKPPNLADNVEITAESTVEDILKKTDYYYATHDFDKVIELDELALKKTNDRNIIAKINFSLSSNYLEKGIEPYIRNKDDSFYKLSIQYAKKYLEVDPHSWQALGNIGSVYLNTGDWKQAIFYFSEAEKYLDKNNPNYTAIEASRSLAEKMMREPR